jgi:glutamate dehydrogenase/leucine dehydrogenase
MLDEWEAMNQHHEAGGISGKLMVLGGSAGRPEATSRGCLFATREVAKVLGLQMNELTAVIQGFGKVGWHLANLYRQDGVKILAVSDVDGGIYSPNGLNILDLHAYVDSQGTVAGYPLGQAISNSDLLELECDILAPCAVQNVITDENAPRIKAKMIIEGANGPMTPEAEVIINAKKIFIAPDIWANSGGTQVAHFERIQNLHDNRWTEDEVNAKLEKLISQVFKEIYELHLKHNIPMRMACWVKAIGKVTEAMGARGWI